MIERFANDLFRRHVARTAQYQAGHGLDGRRGHSCDTKISDLCVSPSNDHDVGRFHIAVDDVVFVGKSQTLCNLRNPVDQGRYDGHRSSFGENVLELLAVEEFHGHVGDVFIAANVINGDDIRVIESTGRLDFLLKARFEFFNLIATQVKIHGLDRDGAVDHGVDRLIDDPHRALPDDA